MHLEDYFQTDTIESDQVGTIEKIRFKESRIGIEHILEPYLQGDSPERIWQGYRHSLTLEQVYAAITWFLHNRPRLEQYLKRVEEVGEFFRKQQQEKEPPDAIKRARAAKMQRQSAGQG